VKAKVSVQLFDGTTQEAEGAVFGLADRVAFERRFQIPAAKMSDLERWIYMDEDPEVKANPELKGRLKPGGEEFREEWLIYFSYRLLRRSGGTTDDYEVWLEKVDDIEVTFEAEPVANPTEEAPQPGA